MYAEKMEAAVKGRKTTIYSPPFYTSRHGYKMIASTCLNGDGKCKYTQYEGLNLSNQRDRTLGVFGRKLEGSHLKKKDFSKN